MRRIHVLALCCVMLLLSTAVARADRPQEDRKLADYVFTGTVQSVYATGYASGKKEVEYRSYIVELKVEEVTKGARLKKGDTFYANCFQYTPPPRSFEAAGHNKVPDQGQRVKVYVKDDRGHNNGIWPDWFDVLPKADK